MSIYIKTDEKFKSVKNLLEYCYPINKNTKDRDYFRHTTFKDKDCTAIQSHGMRRSFEDLLDLCRTYFPSTSEVKLMKVLQDMGMKYYVCRGIQKVVFHFIGNFYIKASFKDNLRDDYKFISKHTYQLEKLDEILRKVNK